MSRPMFWGIGVLLGAVGHAPPPALGAQRRWYSQAVAGANTPVITNEASNT